MGWEAKPQEDPAKLLKAQLYGPKSFKENPGISLPPVPAPWQLLRGPKVQQDISICGTCCNAGIFTEHSPEWPKPSIHPSSIHPLTQSPIHLPTHHPSIHPHIHLEVLALGKARCGPALSPMGETREGAGCAVQCGLGCDQVWGARGGARLSYEESG